MRGRLPVGAGGPRKKLIARLDAEAGDQWEGEELPEICDADRMAKRIFNFLSNGMGGIDWSGLDLICEKLGVDVDDDLLDRLLVIKTWRPPDDDAPPPEDKQEADGAATL